MILSVSRHSWIAFNSLYCNRCTYVMEHRQQSYSFSTLCDLSDKLKKFRNVCANEHESILKTFFFFRAGCEIALWYLQ